MIKTQLTIRKLNTLTGLAADIRLPITLGRSTALLGKDEEIERYITEETAEAIPLIKDMELIRFTINPEPDETRTITPFFRNSTGIQSNDYLSAGFSTLQVLSLSQGLARSIYVFEIYDSQDTDKQKLLARSFTKGDDISTYQPVLNSSGVTISNTPLLQFSTTAGVPTTISPIGLPIYFLTLQPSGTVYLQISFFNSATGKRVKMRRTVTGSSIAVNRYIELIYDMGSRKYYLPLGSNINIEEAPIPTTSVEAEIERKRRLSSSIATPALGNFQPLGKP